MTENKSKELNKALVIKPATLEELRELAQRWNLGCTDEELVDIQKGMNASFSSSYQRLSELVSPTLPVKFPRTPGYRPTPEENSLNAWYWKCDIKGVASGILKDKKVAIKDSVCVAGVPMINGSRILEGYIPDIDATVVTKVLESGGNIVGKANCEYLCLSADSWTNCTGPCLNPRDKTRSAGGSSSGCAALVCNGEVDMAIGGDQGGSIRVPSSLCGVVGLKPTWGLVPYTGVMSIEMTVDHVGPMARTVKDCAILLQAIAGYDNGYDPRQPINLTVPKYSELLDSELTGKKIAVVKEGFDNCEDDVVLVVKGAIDLMAKAGAVIEEVTIPMHLEGGMLSTPVCILGAYKNMIEGNGHGYNWKGFYHESMQEALSRGFRCRAQDLSDSVKYFILHGTYVEKNYGNKFYAKAQNLRIPFRQAYDKVLEKYDVLVMPTVLAKAPKLPEKSQPKNERPKSPSLRNTFPFDLTGHPSLSINAGFSEGLPVGLMITGKHFDETMVLQVAHAFERLRDGQ